MIGQRIKWVNIVINLSDKVTVKGVNADYALGRQIGEMNLPYSVIRLNAVNISAPFKSSVTIITINAIWVGESIHLKIFCLNRTY